MGMVPCHQDFQAQLLQNLSILPQIRQYLTNSLNNRIQTDNWYENRIIRTVLRNPGFLDHLEQTLEDAHLEAVDNSEEIFGVLNGTEEDYDEQLIDAIAEVRSVRWARLVYDRNASA